MNGSDHDTGDALDDPPLRVDCRHDSEACPRPARQGTSSVLELTCNCGCGGKAAAYIIRKDVCLAFNLPHGSIYLKDEEIPELISFLASYLGGGL